MHVILIYTSYKNFTPVLRGILRDDELLLNGGEWGLNVKYLQKPIPIVQFMWYYKTLFGGTKNRPVSNSVSKASFTEVGAQINR